MLFLALLFGKNSIGPFSLLFLWLFLVTLINGDTTTTKDADNDEEELGVKLLIESLPTTSFYINGTWETTTTPEHVLAVVDPSTGLELAQLAVASQEDVNKAVQAARQAFDKGDWSHPDHLPERIQLVENLLNLYQQHSEDMGYLISREMGSPIDEALESQVGSGEDAMEGFLELVTQETFRMEGNMMSDPSTSLIKQPIGVAVLITPWNWPMNQIMLKLTPCLLTGCTCILKPSEESPLSAIKLFQLIESLDFPPGVVQLLQGDGPSVGQWLSSHVDVDMVSFTGSTRAGQAISVAAAPTMKRVKLEMGGKGANIIFEDAPLPLQTITAGVNHVMGNSGQTCNAPTRMIVHTSLYDEAMKIAKNVAETYPVNSAHVHGDFHIGPVVNQRQYDRIQSLIQSGIDEGAELLAGGLGKPLESDGYFVKPTIFANCQPHMKIFQEEIFGPVLCLTKFETLEEALTLANDTPYGLTNYVHTASPTIKRRMAYELQSGMVIINHAGLAWDAPFGGVKASGNAREGGLFGLDEYIVIKAVGGMDNVEDEDEEEDDYDDEDEEEEYDDEEAVEKDVDNQGGLAEGEL